MVSRVLFYPVSCRDVASMSFDDVLWCDSSQILGDMLMFYTDVDNGQTTTESDECHSREYNAT